ncbi:MAG: formylglycine-generating enzyme family protein [Planctomycetota bacterium]
MIFTPQAALAALLLSPATLQFAVLQNPDPATAAAKVPAASDVRHFLRHTSGGPVTTPPQGMVLIPGGSVLLGTAVERIESLGQNDPIQIISVLAETPRRTVSVNDFLIDITEVTNLQWKVYLDETGRKPSATLLEFNWPDGAIPKGLENHPITNVNIPEIRDFLVWCGKRLPTEDEWTRAARGNDDREFPWGSKWDDKLCRSGMDATQHAVAVGSYPGGASPFGVLDMAGNVLEFVDSGFAAYPGFQSYTFKRGKKTQQLTPPFNSSLKVIKGGAYTAVRNFNRIDGRTGLGASESDEAVGFRAARSAKAGLDSIRHALRRLQPPLLAKVGIDEQDVFGREDIGYDEKRGVITGFRHLAFAHRAPERGPLMSKLRGTSVDEPVALGVLSTSEPLVMHDMPKVNGANAVALPPGEYLLAFKGEGESKAHKEKRRLEKKNGSGKGKDKDDDGAPAAEPGAAAGGAAASGPASGDASAPGRTAGAAAPWPGVLSVHDIEEDLEFPQDQDLILFFNANNVVVGWSAMLPVVETDLAPIEEVGSESNRIWDVKFSLDQVAGKRGPRFHLRFELAGDGI